MSFHLLRAAGIALLVATPVPLLAQANGHQQAANAPHGTAQQSAGTSRDREAAPAAQSQQNARHVRACKAKYRSYDARTDTYRTNSGQTRRCTL